MYGKISEMFIKEHVKTCRNDVDGTAMIGMMGTREQRLDSGRTEEELVCTITVDGQRDK